MKTDDAMRNMMQRSRAALANIQTRQAARRARARPPRLLLLWCCAAPLVPAALVALFAGRLEAFAADAAGFLLFALAALLARRDPLAAERSRRYFARHPRLPVANLAGIVAGAGTALVAVAGAGSALGGALAFAALTVIGFHLLYGYWPWSAGWSAMSGRESRLVMEALAEAEGRLINIEQSARAIANAELSGRLTRIADLGRDILARIAERPADLGRARRFLTVFLEGAEQVSDGYARTHRHGDAFELERNFRAVLTTIEAQFERQRERLQQADALDLDIQIEVLRKQIEQEGIR